MRALNHGKPGDAGRSVVWPLASKFLTASLNCDRVESMINLPQSILEQSHAR